MNYDPASHYDRVTAAWTLLLGEELHYGVFSAVTGRLADLSTATNALTHLMTQAAALESDVSVLDVGCGTGAPACGLADAHPGVRVTGITTSAEGIAASRARAQAMGVADRVTFERRDATSNGFPDKSFDRVLVLESSHLMRRRDQLMSECARVLRPGGRLALCDVIRCRPLDLTEVRRLREPLALLRAVFGDARMEPLDTYRQLATASGLVVDGETDLTAQTRPTFACWRDNAERYQAEVSTLLGESAWRQFVASCDLLERFWDDGTLGYGLITARKPAEPVAA